MAEADLAPEVAPVVLALRGVRQSRCGGGQRGSGVLNGVDLELPRGAFTAVTGPAGAGKSALIAVAGLSERPSAGRVSVCGRDTERLDDGGLAALRSRHIGVVLQHHQLVTAFSTLENVLLPMLDDSGCASLAMHERAGELVARVGLAPWRHRRAGLLGAAQRQRLAIARALALAPAMLLADEPTGNLDAEGAREVMSLLCSLNREQGLTLLLVTTNHALAAFCGQTLRLAEGRMCA